MGNDPNQDEDELELRPEREHDAASPDEPGSEPPRDRGRLFPLLMAATAVVLVGAVGALVFLLRPWKPAPSEPRPTPTLAASPEPSTAPALPALDASDAFVRALAAGLSAHPELARWLARADLVRTLTAIVSNVADGETPRPHLEFLAPRQRFRVASGGRRSIVADAAGFVGYDGFADAVAALDPGATAAAYRASEPLFDAAYRELGHPEGFRAALDRAIEALLAVPVPAADARLVPHAIGFRWADPKLESLSAAQKQFLRTGPRNVALVQGQLRALRAALAAAAPPATPVEAPPAAEPPPLAGARAPA